MAAVVSAMADTLSLKTIAFKVARTKEAEIGLEWMVRLRASNCY